MAAETLSFKACGRGLTDHIRLRFMSGDIKGGIEVFNCLTPDDPKSVPDYGSLLKDIITGKRGFKGISPDVHLDEDAQNEDITSLALTAAFQSSDKDGIGVVAKILEVNDPIEHIVHLKTFTTDLENFDSGWITKLGNFIPVGFSKHDQTLHDIDERYKLDLYNPVAHFEQRWVRISQAYGGQFLVVQFRGEKMYPVQEKAFMSWLEANPKVFTLHQLVEILGYGRAWKDEDGRITLEKRDELDS